MSGDKPQAQLYLVTPRQADLETLTPALAAALAVHSIACLRIDLGDAPEAEWRRAVNHLMPVAHAHDVALVVAEHHRLVAPLGLDGVHLGTSRTPVREARKALGADRIVGAFGGTTKHLAMTLAEAGADYVSLGPVGDTGALGDGKLVDDEIFRWWAEMIETPVVAEGGVGPEDAGRLAAFADFIVPDMAVWSAPGGLVAGLEPYVAALKA